MMRIYIVRHADALPQAPGSTDAERPLSDKGRNDASCLAKVMEYLELDPEEIWTSPYLRARQTAELICEELANPPQLIEKDFLACPGNFEHLRNAIRELPPPKALMLVGHMPFLGECVQYWASGHAHPGMHLPKGSLVELRAEGFLRGHMNMRSMLTPKQSRKIAKLIG